MSERRLNDTAPFTDRFLEDARDTHQRVSVYLVNGFQLKGEVVTFDEDTILFKSHSNWTRLGPRWSSAGQALGGGGHVSSSKVQPRSGGVVAQLRPCWVKC